MPLSIAQPPDRHCCSAAADSRGFTLIEVLITAAVILVALTGMLTLQLVGIKAVQTTYYRSQATALAYQMSDNLRANRGLEIDTTTALGGAYDDVTLCRSGARHPNDQRGCDIDALADIPQNGLVLNLDLSDWWSAMEAAGLPNWFAEIQRVTPGTTSDRRFRIVVQWDDSHVESESEAVASTKPSCTGDQIPLQMEEVCLVTEL